jgi:hypothetical protein
LPERDILKNQFVMPTAGDSQRATEQQNHVQHAVNSVVPGGIESTVNRRR